MIGELGKPRSQQRDTVTSFFYYYGQRNREREIAGVKRVASHVQGDIIALEIPSHKMMSMHNCFSTNHHKLFPFNYKY